MTGRVEVSFCEASPCWRDSAEAWGKTEVAPIPAATLPITDVFTKSRREKVTDPPERSGLVQQKFVLPLYLAYEDQNHQPQGTQRNTGRRKDITGVASRSGPRTLALHWAEMAAPRGSSQ